MLVGPRVLDIKRNLKLLASHRQSGTGIQAGANDICLGQSEPTKNEIEEVCTLAQTML